MKVLVIVDMQDYFNPSEETQQIVEKLVKYAMSKNIFIINLIYDLSDDPETDIKNMDDLYFPNYFHLIKNYSKTHTVIKDRDNGSHVIHEFLSSNEKFKNISNLYIAGINFLYCVKYTAIDLKNKYKYSVKVIKEATDYCSYKVSLPDRDNVDDIMYGKFVNLICNETNFKNIF